MISIFRNPRRFLYDSKPGFGRKIQMATKVKTKIKTHKGTKKRFRLSANGKAMHRQSGTSHLAQGLSKKRRRNLRGTTSVDTCMEPMIHAALNGYSN
jgi:large subunit ribosomal protein L35